MNSPKSTKAIRHTLDNLPRLKSEILDKPANPTREYSLEQRLTVKNTNSRQANIRKTIRQDIVLLAYSLEWVSLLLTSLLLTVIGVGVTVIQLVSLLFIEWVSLLFILLFICYH